MEEVISLSSGSEEDSDIEVVGVYSDTEIKAAATPFIRGEWVHVAAYTGPVRTLACPTMEVRVARLYCHFPAEPERIQFNPPTPKKVPPFFKTA